MIMHFFVPGTPVPQGSKRVVRGRLIDVNQDSLRQWRSAIVRQAQGWISTHRPLRFPLDGPVSVVVGFDFPRPKCHFGTGRNAHIVKSRFREALMAVKPDLDKLVRAVLDALTDAGVWVDDSRVDSISATKSWVTDGEPGIRIWVFDDGGERV